MIVSNQRIDKNINNNKKVVEIAKKVIANNISNIIWFVRLDTKWIKMMHDEVVQTVKLLWAWLNYVRSE